MTDEITFHYDTSTVLIADRAFPACALVCPEWPGRPDPRWNRMLGQPWLEGPMQRNCLVVIPMENGVLASVMGVVWRDGRTTYDAMIDHLVCEVHEIGTDPHWMPTAMALAGNIIRPYRPPRAQPWPRRPTAIWNDAEPGWLAEFLPRLARYPVSPPPPDAGPICEVISLAEMLALWNDHLVKEST